MSAPRRLTHTMCFTLLFSENLIVIRDAVPVAARKISRFVKDSVISHRIVAFLHTAAGQIHGMHRVLCCLVHASRQLSVKCVS